MASVTVFRGSPDGKLVEGEAPARKPPQGREVAIRITHSGVCATDELYKTAENMVLGHEGVGIVEAIGPSVVKFKVGDRAGWGYCHGSCQDCDYCDKGHEQYCDRRQVYGYASHEQGSFASHATWDEGGLVRIPDAIPSADAAPLMCAGSTVYGALRDGGIQWHHRVGVYGLGGLGHLAVQFAAKMGCHVTVYSHSPDKEAEARELGASDFQHVSNGPLPVGQVDCLMLTAASQPDWAKFLPVVRRGALICALTVSFEDLKIQFLQVVTNGLRIQGSLPAGPRIQRQMLNWVAQHGIKPILENFPFTENGVNDAMEKLERGKMRYRGVLSWDP